MAASSHDRLIGRAIIAAVLRREKRSSRKGIKALLARLVLFFRLFRIPLECFEPELFHRLREEAFKFSEDEYRDSFSWKEKGKKARLNPVGDLGYSGSTFFETIDSKFLIKALPRRFEYTFFTEDMLPRYVEHVESHPASLLIRIADFLAPSQPSVGGMTGITPTHHMVMENLLYGKGDDVHSDQWETYDLKPSTYFFPERDIADGALAPESVKDRLIDTFPDKVRITAPQFADLRALLEADTALLRDTNAVDYSLFLVRFPALLPMNEEDEIAPPRRSLNSRPSAWRSGVSSADGKWVYRAALLDFFWAKHKLQAQAMTGLIRSFNIFAKKGDMSITTTPEEYRQRFLRMVSGLVEVDGVSAGQGAGGDTDI